MTITRTLIHVVAVLAVAVFFILSPFAVMDLLGGNDNAIVAGLGGALYIVTALGFVFSDSLELNFGPFRMYRNFVDNNRYVAPVWRYVFSNED
ncbi:hypothetical protein BIZ82_gp065 [Erwinia phage vB_EamM_EarlPhillipIV]|nr:hypothetical protein BIZ82_gp065 [Erwinia phage vB_EamM_EarlPhillipIV]ANZ48915.1 hypothetical protein EARLPHILLIPIV_65 [Erwinia phage vB_EamM_EarlPhillipIV]QXO09786.1 hypothetical protein pEaSNUABM38_00064 [Erwinia phage pEa_SNUABM_38]